MVAFDDGQVATLANKDVKPFSWKPGSSLYCRFGPRAPYHRAKITRTQGDTIIYDRGYRTISRYKIRNCREEIELAWWHQMSALFKDHARYRRTGGMPRKPSRQPGPGEVRRSLDIWPRTADGGQYVKIKKCVVTARKWRDFFSGGTHTSRRKEVACAVGIPIPPHPRKNEACILLYADCEQKHAGRGNYQACTYRPSGRSPKRIDCRKTR